MFRTIVITLMWLAVIVLPAHGQPNGSDNAPFKTIDRQARRIDQGQHSCGTTTTTIISAADLSGCFSLMLRNGGTERVVFCVDDSACTDTTGGMYADEGDAVIYDKELNANVNGTGIECDATTGTNTVFWTLACAQ